MWCSTRSLRAVDKSKKYPAWLPPLLKINRLLLLSIWSVHTEFEHGDCIVLPISCPHRSMYQKFDRGPLTLKFDFWPCKINRLLPLFKWSVHIKFEQPRQNRFCYILPTRIQVPESIIKAQWPWNLTFDFENIQASFSFFVKCTHKVAAS